jgi:hypothetical protein
VMALVGADETHAAAELAPDVHALSSPFRASDA